jgi:hypothetical protein
MPTHPLRLAALSLLLLACAPQPPAGPGPSAQGYVVRVSTGEIEGVAVDWAILPDEGWPVDGGRDRTPFSRELPPGQVTALFRVRGRAAILELTVLKRLPDGTLKPVARANHSTVGVVLLDPARETPSILTTPTPDGPGER